MRLITVTTIWHCCSTCWMLFAEYALQYRDTRLNNVRKMQTRVLQGRDGCILGVNRTVGVSYVVQGPFHMCDEIIA